MNMKGSIKARWYDVFYYIDGTEIVYDTVEIFPTDWISEDEDGDIFEDKTVPGPCFGVTVKAKSKAIAVERADKLIRARLGR